MKDAPVKALLGPTNTGKTHYALERLCGHSSGMIGFPLRLLAREAYDRVVAAKGVAHVGLVTGEERILPPTARWLLCTAESMPVDRDVAFVALDEAQLGGDFERGHVFTERLLNVRGREETVILGSGTIGNLVRELVPGVDLISRPRFSQLRYAAPKKISRLPPRTAIIAFNAEDVYAIAELVRRTRGGAAIVMGNLSPGTRNAQVAMYQSGEVDFIVATDAIGMGLNMDVDHVAFASLSKFDGQRHRRLRVHEMAQIAGRAGRHQRDGTFGIALSGADSPEFDPEDIDRIEEHRFARQTFLYWRNASLDFADPDALLASLAEPPPHPSLRPSPEADDHRVLRRVFGSLGARAGGWNEARTRRLWDACGLPDFRGSGPEFHATLVSRIFDHIGQGTGIIPTDTLNAEVSRLDSVQGDVATLAGRLAGIRTWCYIANRADWVAHPAEWIARTHAVESRLSDTLHERLVERFVERRSSRLLRAAKAKLTASDVQFCADGVVLALSEPVGEMQGLRFVPYRNAADSERIRLIAAAEGQVPAQQARIATDLLSLPLSAFRLSSVEGHVPVIVARDINLTTLERGRSLILPSLSPVPEVAKLEPRLRHAVLAKCREVLKHLIAQRLFPLARLHALAFDPDTPADVRAFLAQLTEAGGALPRAALASALARLSGEHRNQLRRLGLTFGSLGLFHPALLKPEAMRLRLALMAVQARQPMPPLPMPGMVLLDRPAPALADAAAKAGFIRIGDQMLRLDMAERIARALHDQRGKAAHFVPDTRLATSLGIGQETFQRMLRTLGFVPMGPTAPDQWRWRGLSRPPHRQRRRGAA